MKTTSEVHFDGSELLGNPYNTSLQKTSNICNHYQTTHTNFSLIQELPTISTNYFYKIRCIQDLSSTLQYLFFIINFLLINPARNTTCLFLRFSKMKPKTSVSETWLVKLELQLFQFKLIR